MLAERRKTKAGIFSCAFEGVLELSESYALCEVKFGYGGFLDFAHEAHAGVLSARLFHL